MIHSQRSNDPALVGTGAHTFKFALGDLDLHYHILCLLLNLAETDRSVFDKGLTSCQRHDHRDTSIKSVDRHRRIMQHGIYKGSHLSAKALGIALDEEVKR